VRGSARNAGSKSTKDEVEEFSLDIPTHLRSIQARLNCGSYRFSVPRPVLAPREGKEPRPLLVRPVSDRVVERAILQTLQTRTKVQQLIEGASSFGAIPERGVRMGVEAVVEAIREGATHYVRSDIGGFFQHIPRRQVMERIETLLPDDSVVPLLNQATEVNNKVFSEEAVGRYRDLYPTPEEGVAQGGGLSAFFGNVAMERFDAMMSEDGVTTVRYVDDFITLARSQAVAMERFRQGEEYLATMDMKLYPPDGSMPEKAAQGETRTLFEFLGCEISASFVRPSRQARERIVGKVRERFDEALADLRTGAVARGSRRKSSIVRTLADVHNVVRSWSGSYSFCNADQILRTVDRQIDREIARFLGEAGRIRRQTADENETMGRRVLGVFPTVDGRKNPLYGGAPKAPEDT